MRSSKLTSFLSVKNLHLFFVKIWMRYKIEHFETLRTLISEEMDVILKDVNVQNFF